MYVLDEHTTGLHPLDVDRLREQQDNLVSAGHKVIGVEAEMRVVGQSEGGIEIGPGGGETGERDGLERAAAETSPGGAVPPRVLLRRNPWVSKTMSR